MLEGTGSIKGAVSAEANSKVQFAGQTTLSASTKLEGAGNFIVSGSLVKDFSFLKQLLTPFYLVGRCFCCNHE